MKIESGGKVFFRNFKINNSIVNKIIIFLNLFAFFKREMNILASRNQDSGVEEPTFQTQKPPLIDLITFNKKFQQ